MMGWDLEKLQIYGLVVAAVVLVAFGLERRARRAGARAQERLQARHTLQQTREAWDAHTNAASSGRNGLLERLRSAGF